MATIHAVHGQGQHGADENAEGVQGGRRGKGGRKEMSSLMEVFANVSAGIDTKAKTRAAAHPRLVICVSLRMAASAVAPSAPMLLPLSL